MTSSYQPDILGPDFEQQVLPQLPDYEGPVHSTLVRRRPTRPASRAVLYVHGFNDYFFQREMAERYHEHGYHFYALDLRKYGRSWQPHQRPNNVRDLREYFADLDAALAVVRAEGYRAVLLSGHSTGGLVTALYAREGQGRAAVSALFLNSPFLAMHLPRGVRHLAMSLAAMGRFAPDVVIPGTRLTTYGESLHRQHRGEWDYHLPWKPVEVFPVNVGWLGAIAEGHRRIRRGLGLQIPVLVLHADRTVQARGWSEEYFQADGVLNVRDMQMLAPGLGTHVTVRAIAGGMHDLMLSRQPAREQAYRELFAWLATSLGE
ncbi:alpha/beta hydrolase [Hymenobacter arizonensis]|uniref:Lysophospholipase, alpha-beta hydrolase superfamily n=1 Tax=Hymenobacter arizonensis TaxID=1227077 RepID=A0A1I5UJE0_HYMAR|nr:alpha/beta hydrolase [Hymenobacter arizonensis]SFP95338.1 Lysophospholipase, alpha-beta hydrolase superfamily [Hymenobacter arizonensis]